MTEDWREYAQDLARDLIERGKLEVALAALGADKSWAQLDSR